MDSRFPTYYLQDRRVLKASPTAFRLFVTGSAWSVSNMTDGLIPSDDFPLIPLAQPHDADELVRLGLWSEMGSGWLIADFQKTQTSAAQLEASAMNRRLADAERKRKKYWKDKEALDALEDMGEATQSNQTSAETPQRLERQGRGKAEAEEEARTMNLPNNETFDPNTGEALDDTNPWKDQPVKSDSGPTLIEKFKQSGRKAS